MKIVIFSTVLFTMMSVAVGFADTFDGYPCQGDCAGHQAGYEWAQRNNVANINQCQSASQSFTEGCISYVHGGRGIIERTGYAIMNPNMPSKTNKDF